MTPEQILEERKRLGIPEQGFVLEQQPKQDNQSDINLRIARRRNLVSGNKEDLLTKLGNVGGKFLSGLGEYSGLFPIARTLEKPFVSTIREIQGEPEKPIETPFGEVKPLAGSESKELLGEAAGLALTVAPIEKLITPILKPLIKPIGKGFKYVSSLIGGYPREMLEVAYKKPEIVSNAIKEASQNPDSAIKLVEKVKNAFQKAKDLRSKNYTEALKNLENNYWMTKSGKQYIKDIEGVWQPVDLSIKGVKDNITKTLKEFGVEVKNAKKGLLDFSETPIPQNQINEIKEVINRVYNWKKITPTGLNNLKKIIDSYYKGSADTAGFDKIITTIKNNLSDYVGEKIPQIAKMNKDYTLATNFINQVSKEFKIKEGQSIESAVNAITSIFNKKSPYRANLVKELGVIGEEELFDDVIAQTLKDWLPEGRLRQLAMGLGAISGAILKPASILGIPFASPRVAAGLATTAGKVAKKLPGLVEELKAPVRGIASGIMEKLTK